MFTGDMIRDMQKAGINVVVRDEVIEHFAVIDDVLVGHGRMNLLGKEDAWDNLIIEDSIYAGCCRIVGDSIWNTQNILKHRFDVLGCFGNQLIESHSIVS